ncbi:MAG TPA: hypothetical protein VKZ59_16035 [Acidobacteriota bacterium]|nr:hypothetical protein [Acidobacteriota bacterium]
MILLTPRVSLTGRLKEEYVRLFDTCIIRPEKAEQIEETVIRIENCRERYSAIGDLFGIPWYFLGVVHNMESSLNFSCHLHNGDPLTDRTVHVPANRPAAGSPPFTWEESTIDLIRLKRLDRQQRWSLPSLLHRLEGYNGWGYRLFHPHVLSPYLWGGSHHYTRGKYTADGVWSEMAVSKQIGAAVLLRRMAERGTTEIEREETSFVRDEDPAICFSNREEPHARRLQEFLNGFPEIFLRVDGVPGSKTSDAFKKVFGHYLKGDPREESPRRRRSSR